MKKTLKMQDLGCANCALKMENAIAKLDGVKNININFMMQKMTIEAEDALFDTVIDSAAKIVRKIEPDCRLVV